MKLLKTKVSATTRQSIQLWPDDHQASDFGEGVDHLMVSIMFQVRIRKTIMVSIRNNGKLQRQNGDRKW